MTQITKKNRYLGVLGAIFLCLGFSSTAEAIPGGTAVASIAATFGASGLWDAAIGSRNKPAEKETEAFVRDALKRANYSQEQIDKVKILEGPGFRSGMGKLVVPITDEKLQRARDFYTNKKVLEGSDERSVQFLQCWLSGVYSTKLSDLTNEEVEAFLQANNTIVTKESIPLWHGTIVHEMGHIIHHHKIKQKMFYGLLQASLVAVLASRFSPDGAWHYPVTVGIGCVVVAASSNFLRPLLRPFERQADQEVVDRMQDPEPLEVLQKTYAGISRIHEVTFSKTIRLLDEHPSPKERADTFKTAYERLFAEQKAVA